MVWNLSAARLLLGFPQTKSISRSGGTLRICVWQCIKVARSLIKKTWLKRFWSIVATCSPCMKMVFFFFLLQQEPKTQSCIVLFWFISYRPAYRCWVKRVVYFLWNKKGPTKPGCSHYSCNLFGEQEFYFEINSSKSKQWEISSQNHKLIIMKEEGERLTIFNRRIEIYIFVYSINTPSKLNEFFISKTYRKKQSKLGKKKENITKMN